MDYLTQPTQQTAEATQNYIIEKFSQEKIGDDVVCRVICTTGHIKIQDLILDVRDLVKIKDAIKKVWTFGRNRHTCDYHLGDINRLSNKHFQIMLGEDGNLMLKDISTNGTWLNGMRVGKSQNMILSQGDEISVGKGVAQDIVNLVIFFNENYRKQLDAVMFEGLRGTSKNGEDSGLRGMNQFTGIFSEFAIKDEVVGQGAFATVKKAVERKTGKTYAVKIINKRKVMGNVDGVTRESEVLRRLDHPRIVSLKGFYEDDDSYYLVMEFVSGGDLMDFVAAHGSVGEEAGREITTQILEAIEHIHNQGIIHRDLKPDNILIEQDDPVLVKLTDFGLAKIHGSGTFMKTFCGTLAYVAPEVIDGKQNENTHEDSKNLYSSLVDMWSLGCLVYVILTGHLPFSGSTQEQLYRQIACGSYHEGPLRDFRISEEARDFIDSLLQVNPKERLSAENALKHPWIKTVSSQSNRNPNVSLSQSLSQQKLVENMDETQYEFLLAERKAEQEVHEKLESLKEQKKVETQFKVPTQPSLRLNNMKLQIPAVLDEKTTLLDVKAGDANSSHKLLLPQIKRRSQKGSEGRFLTLTPLCNSATRKRIFVNQGINPYVIGRSDECHSKIDDNRLSRVHCFLLKKRHPVGNSIYESPAQGLDDIWYCHTGTNSSFVNDFKLTHGTKILIQDGDEIKIIWDKTQNLMIAYRVEIHDTVGLFNARGTKCSRELVKQSSDELTFASAFIDFRRNQAIHELSPDDSCTKSPHSEKHSIQNGICSKRHALLSLSQDITRKAKRAKLAQAQSDDNGFCFL